MITPQRPNEREAPAPPRLYVPDEERFRAAERKIEEKAEAFFGSARLTPNYEGYFQIFRMALKAVRFEPHEEVIYDDWLDIGAKEEVARGKESHWLTAEQMVYLGQNGDPSMFVIDRLETIRNRDYPSVELDQKVRQSVFGAYTLLGAGVHRDTLFPEAIALGQTG